MPFWVFYGIVRPREVNWNFFSNCSVAYGRVSTLLIGRRAVVICWQGKRCVQFTVRIESNFSFTKYLVRITFLLAYTSNAITDLNGPMNIHVLTIDLLMGQNYPWNGIGGRSRGRHFSSSNQMNLGTFGWRHEKPVQIWTYKLNFLNIYRMYLETKCLYVCVFVHVFFGKNNCE